MGVHELAHFYRRNIMSSGELEHVAEVFGIKDRNNWTVAEEERFAEAAEDYFRTGRTEHTGLRDIFDRIAKFVVDAYRNMSRSINMSDDIRSVFDELYQADGSVLRAAEEAVRAADEQTEPAGEQTEPAEEQTEPAEEHTDTVRKNERDTVPQEKVSQEAPEEKKTTLPVRAEEYLDNVNASPDVTAQAKTGSALAATGEQYTAEEINEIEALINDYYDSNEGMDTVEGEDNENFYPDELDDEMLFQLIGAKGAAMLDRALVLLGRKDSKGQIISNVKLLESAQALENMGATAEQIKINTLADKDSTQKYWLEIADGSLINKEALNNNWIMALKAACEIYQVRDADRQSQLIADFQQTLSNIKATIGLIYSNPNLFKAYPGIENMPVRFTFEQNAVKGSFSSAGILINYSNIQSVDDLEQTLMHELQHIIQAIEYSDEVWDAFRSNESEWNYINDILRKAYGNDFEFASFVPREKLLKILENYKDSDRFLKAYNSPWEVQARNVVARSGFSQQMRQSTLLRSTEEFLQHVDGKNISTTLSPDQQASLDRQTQRAETLGKFFGGRKKEGDSILFQLLGAKGAAALDAAEDRTERMNNLSVAGQMEAAGKDAKTIRLATGWEKGADGKWRYEIADQKAFLLEDYLKQNSSVIREAAAYSEKAAEDLLKFQEEKGGHPAGGRRSGGVKYSEEDLETWNFLETVRRQAQDTLYGHLKEELEKDDLTLDDLMHGTELLKAYPELGDVTVRFAGTYNNGAYFSPEENEIVISPSIASHERPSVLLHEVQHAVQEIEGFARGGNIQQFTEESEKPTELQEFLLLLHRIPKDDIRNYKEHEEWKILKSYLPDVLEKNIGGLGTLEEIVDRKLRDIEAGFGTVDSLYDEIQESRLAYDRYHRTNGFENEKSPYEKYRSLAGETEARNVQARMNMTPEQRLATLLRETEDVPRQDQTVLFQTIAERKQAQFDLISRENPMTDDYHTGIRSAEEIRTFAEAMEDDESFFYGDYKRSDAERDLARGKVTVYSSKSIMKGDFVSTSRNMARDYAGSGRIYSREVSVDDVAWINGDEGQYAPLSDVLYSVMDGMPLSDMVMNEITAAADSSESAEDFREMCESGWVLSDEAQKDIEGADSAWYRNTWERVKGISPTTYEEQEKGRTEYREATTADPDPIANDSIFFTQMKTRNGMLEGFLRQIAEILGQDAEQWRADALDEEDAAEAEALINLQRRIRSMQNQSVLSNAKRVKNGNPLTDRMRKSILSAIKNKLRDYRGLYALVMQDAQFAVSVSDSGSIELKEYAAANKLDVNVDDMGFSDRAKLADRIREEKISGAVKDGSIVLDGDLEFYRKTLEERTRIAEKKYRDLEQRTKEDYNDLSHAEQRDLLKVYGKLLDLRAEMEVKGIDVPKKADRAIESLSRYNRDLSGIQARYSNLYDQYKDLAKHMETAGELRGKLDRIENLKKVRAEYRRLRQEEHALRELKDLRLRLIRRAMRKVDFRTVDYDAGVALIALQEVFDPNLRSGINRWIRSEEVTAEEIWTDFKTDEDRKQAIIEVLSRSKTGEKFIAKLEKTATLGDLESWNEADVRSLERRMMKGNWVKELQLEQLRRGREKAVQLDITRKLKKVATGELDENGDEIYRNEDVAEFSDEVYAVMAKHFSDELIEKIQNKPVSMWSLQEMADLAQAVNEVYRQGKDALNARRMREQADAMQLRDGIRRQVMKTGIVINPDDPEKVKEKKRAKINRMLGLSDTIKGTSDDTSKRQSRWSRIFSGYHDANIRRVARILDGYTEGTATNLLYWQENECWTRQERSKDRRNARIESVLKEAKIDVADLYRTYTVSWTDTSTGLLTEHRLSADDVLFFAQAYRNNESYRQQQRDEGVPEHLIEEESGYQAVVYGNLMNIQEKEQYLRMDESAREAERQRLMNLRSAQLAGNEELIREYSALTADTHDDKGSLLLPGRQRIVELCRQRMDEIMHLHDMIVQDIPGISRLQDVIAEDYAQEFDRLNRVSIEEFNTPVLREKWYLPLVRLSKTGDTNENRLKQDLLGAVPGTGQAGTDRGMTRSRIRIAPEHQAPVETGLYRTWADSVERNEHFIAYAGYVRTLNKVFMNRDAAPTMQVIEGRYGTGMAEYLKRYVQEVANPDAGRQRTAMDQVIRVFRGNTAPAYLAWKLSSIIKQGLSSPMPYMQFVNPVEYAAAALKVLGSGQVREAIAGRSQFMKSRTFDPIVDVIAEQQAKARNPLAYRLKNFEAKGMAGLEWIDYVCVAPGWLAIYEKEKSKLMKEYDSRLAKRVAELREENGELSLGDRLSAAEIKARAAAELDEDMETAAVNRADDCVRLCQPSNRSVDIAPMFKEGGELSKAFLQFQTSLNVIWQNIRYDIPYNLRNRIYRETVGMVCGYVAAGLALGLVCEGLGGDDGSEEDKLRRSIYFATTQFTDSMPIIGSQMSAAMRRLITGEKQFSSGVDLFPTLTKFRDAGFALHDGDYEKAVKKLADGFAISSGLPYSGARELLYAAGIGDGDGEPGFHPEAFVGRRQ